MPFPISFISTRNIATERGKRERVCVCISITNAIVYFSLSVYDANPAHHTEDLD